MIKLGIIGEHTISLLMLLLLLASCARDDGIAQESRIKLEKDLQIITSGNSPETVMKISRILDNIDTAEFWANTRPWIDSGWQPEKQRAAILAKEEVRFLMENFDISRPLMFKRLLNQKPYTAEDLPLLNVCFIIFNKIKSIDAVPYLIDYFEFLAKNDFEEHWETSWYAAEAIKEITGGAVSSSFEYNELFNHRSEIIRETVKWYEAHKKHQIESGQPIAEVKKTMSPEEEAVYLEAVDAIKIHQIAKLQFETRRLKESRLDSINLIENIIKQYPNTPHLANYLETLSLLKQMVQEDQDIDSKYKKSLDKPRREAMTMEKGPKDGFSSADEMIEFDVYDLRNHENFIKVQGCYKMSAGLLMPFLLGGGGYEIHRMYSPVQRLLADGGISIEPHLVKLLNDRRPIFAADDDPPRIPARFYRYQDAAVEILQAMFGPEGHKINPKLPLATKQFPLELPPGEYFSEYLEKQTPEKKQQIINDIKDWAEVAKNLLEQSDK